MFVAKVGRTLAGEADSQFGQAGRDGLLSVILLSGLDAIA
jgi:hypothetical protein